MSDRPRLILASESPRRRALLAQIGLTPDDIIPAQIDETPFKGELPRAYAIRLAKEKALSVLNDQATEEAIILAADTVVACGRRILPKAETEKEARACLELLSGRTHQVYTGFAITLGKDALRERLVTTKVTFKRLSDEEEKAYIASKEWQGKAGGYAIQGLASSFIQSINGSYSNVVGLPLFEVTQMLQGLGYPVTKSWP